MNRLIPLGMAVAALAALVGGGVILTRAPHAATTETAAERPSVLTVTATTPQTQDWPQTLVASSALAAWQEAVIGAEVGNLRITELFADVGSPVVRGQELARLSQDSTPE